MGSVASPVWAQELEIHWPKNWRFLQARAALLEEFDPSVFTFSDKGVFLRVGEHHDVRLSQYGVHFRILAIHADMVKVQQVLERVLFHMSPKRLQDLRASFALVSPVKGSYDDVRRLTAKHMYGAWASDKQLDDYTIAYNMTAPEGSKHDVLLGVADRDQLIDQIAQAVSTEEKYLRERTPPWMKVRLPGVALFMKSRLDAAEPIDKDVDSVVIRRKWESWQGLAVEEFVRMRTIVGSLIGDPA